MPVRVYRCPVRYVPIHNPPKYTAKPPVYATAIQFSRFSVFHRTKNIAAAVPAGSAFRSATVLKRCWLFRKAPRTVLPDPKTRIGAQSRNRVVPFSTSTVDLANSPPAIHGARSSIRIKIPNPILIKANSRLLVKYWYSARGISFSRVTKRGTRLNLAPSRTIVSTTNTTVNAVISASAVSLKPNRLGINRTRTRRLNPMPAHVMTITQRVL